MRILGVDPGSLVTGWGLLAGNASAPRIVECGLVDPGPSGWPLERRLGTLAREMECLARRLTPDYVAVETPFHGANVRSALQLAHARGAILAGLDAAGLPVGAYSPAAVKKAVTGNGRASKEQVRSMVERLPGGGEIATNRTSDAADALAVAWCHAATAGWHAAVARAEAASGRRSSR